MNQIMLKFATVIVIVFSFVGSFGADHEHAKHNESTAAKLELDHGKKWATDLPLRQSMDKLDQLVKENIASVHSEKMSDDAYKILGQKMMDQTNNIFKNCKLTAQADQVLHQILIPILKTEQVFLGKDKSLGKHEAFMAVMDSLENYGKYFDHKGWGVNGK